VKHPKKIEPASLQDAIATAEVLVSLGQSEAQAIAKDFSDDARIEFSRTLCANILARLWDLRIDGRRRWPVRTSPVPLKKSYTGLIERIGDALSVLSNERAGFLVGQLYTALLPEQHRKSFGAYYTPPPLVDRLLHLVEQSNIDWGRFRVIDPACGGAAFLASVAPRMLADSKEVSAEKKLQDVERRLVGVELDTFAAWMSMVLLDISVLDVSLMAGRRIEPIVLPQDALTLPAEYFGHFDLVIGNPPYGKVTLSNELRKRFKESLFGHANLYGIFTELAVRLAKPHGVIAYVTPTSFLGGEYFKQLRGFLSIHAPLSRLDFVTDREGVFDGVLQETMLTVFERKQSRENQVVRLHRISAAEPTLSVTVEVVGSCSLNGEKGNPWLLPRSADQLALVEHLHSMPHRLSDYGFAVSTGQLVWNRHKDQLRTSYNGDCYPIVWAEAVNTDGTFHFQAARRTHLPYLLLKAGQDFLLNHEPCILVQRTTAKEQKRRLIAAVIPNSFVAEYPGFVVENHLNMVYSLPSKPQIGLRTIAALLNSLVLDQAFRCMNGSVAVSAYELNSLPLPNPEQMQRLQEAVLSRMSLAEIELLIVGFYIERTEQNGGTTPSHTSQHAHRVAA
jgi:adenine-specific DNA-methyltransferase